MSTQIRVFWQPHWTSCIRVKDYLKEKGIEFESINIVEDGIETLQSLGAKSVPVVSKGDKYVFAQVIRDVIEFLELDEQATYTFWRLLVDYKWESEVENPIARISVAPDQIYPMIKNQKYQT